MGKNPNEELNLTQLTMISEDMEENLIASILIEGEITPEVWATGITAQDFGLGKCQTIWNIFEELTAEAIPIDINIVSLRLEMKSPTNTKFNVPEIKSLLDEVGGLIYLTDLLTRLPTSIHGPYYAREIVSLSNRRQLFHLAGKLAQSSFDCNGISTDEILEDVRKAISNAKRNTLDVIRASDLDDKIRPIEWLWPGYIPYEEITAIGGREGTGKTATIQDWIRRLLDGHEMPNGARPYIRSKNILFIDAEDFLRDFIDRQRCWKEGGLLKNQDNLYIMKYPNTLLDFTLPEWQDMLIDKMREIQPYLIILDSWQASMLRSTYDHQIATVVQFFKSLIKEFRCAMVCTMQFNKEEGSPYCIPTSSAFKGAGATAYRMRATYGMYRLKVGPDEDLRNDPRITFAFRVSSAPHPEPMASIFKPLHPRGFFVEYIDTADLFMLREELAQEEMSKTDRCRDFLLDLCQSPRSIEQIMETGQSAGFGEGMIRRVLADLRKEGLIQDSEYKSSKSNRIQVTELA